MPEVLQRERTTTTDRLPKVFRSRTVDYTLMIAGAIVAAFGAYTFYAPTDWVWADLAEAWHLSSWIIGGVLLGGGFGLFGASVRDRAGYWTTAAISSFVVGMVALAGAVVAAVVLII